MIKHQFYMKRVLELAQLAAKEDEVPVGALIIDEFGNIIAEAINSREKNHDPLGHAELTAIRLASKNIKNWRLEKCTMYVSLEPCPMCLGAMREARIEKLIFGAYDLKGGALSLGHRLHQDPRLNHRFAVMGGILQSESANLLGHFFRLKRRA